MQKVLALAAVCAIAACSDTPGRLCVKTLECEGKTNEEAVEECSDAKPDDEVDCIAERDTVEACLDEKGTCDTVTVAGVDITGFGLEAVLDGGACETEARALADCDD